MILNDALFFEKNEKPPKKNLILFFEIWSFPIHPKNQRKNEFLDETKKNMSDFNEKKFCVFQMILRIFFF